METYDNAAVGGAIAGMLGTLMVFILAIALVMIVSLWKIFTKAGKPGWAAIIPIYNYIVLLEVAKKPVWWIILFIIPLVSMVIGVIVIHNLSKVFGQGAGFTLGLIFLPFVFFPLLAFGNYTYIDDTQEPVPTFA